MAQGPCSIYIQGSFVKVGDSGKLAQLYVVVCGMMMILHSVGRPVCKWQC